MGGKMEQIKKIIFKRCEIETQKQDEFIDGFIKDLGKPKQIKIAIPERYKGLV